MALTFNKRDFDGMTPGVGHPDKDGAADLFTGLLNTKIQAGSIGVGAAAANVDVDAAYHGKPILLTLNKIDATLFYAVAAWHATTKGRIVVTGNANATAAVPFSLLVYGG